MAANISHLKVMGQSAALADDVVLRWLPKQQLWIDPTRFNQISGENGLRISILPGSFCDTQGRIITERVELELVEIVHKAGMLLAAMPSTSRDGVFESAGMFSLQAKKGEQHLKLIKPLQITWPIYNLNAKPASLQIVTLSMASTRSFSAAAELDWIPFFNKPTPVLKQQGQRWLKFELTQLGWFSAHLPLSREGLKSMLSIRYQDQDFEHKQAFLVFRNHQSVVKLFPYDQKFCAFNIPRRAPACVVMLACKSERYFLGHTCFDGHYANNLTLQLEEVEKGLLPQHLFAIVNR
ncbi:MAG: hypothetical protein SFV55_19955 [Haliscomenobacter sp.]|uniref:hypothetical protein n=1 Tax=Haliscomenobacter sp. TaxID=2717303 RepID=UPI0029AFFA29|nr:hypothetical protein [Haliscomenobacter sp.]MDX2070713.1 hypothetical protein [Haliscomenobacter sp.]